MIDRATVTQLDRLYRQREDLQSNREIAADRNFWLGIVNQVAGGTGTRYNVVNALGGNGAVADLLKRCVADRFEVLQGELDSKIEELGGQP